MQSLIIKSRLRDLMENQSLTYREALDLLSDAEGRISRGEDPAHVFYQIGLSEPSALPHINGEWYDE